MKIINISKINNMRRAIKTCKHNIIVTDYPVVDVHVDELSSAINVCDIVRKHKYKYPSSNQSILPFLYC